MLFDFVVIICTRICNCNSPFMDVYVNYFNVELILCGGSFPNVYKMLAVHFLYRCWNLHTCIIKSHSYDMLLG